MSLHNELLDITGSYASNMHAMFSRELKNFENEYKATFSKYPIEDQCKIILDTLESDSIYFFLSSICNDTADKVTFLDFLNLIQKFSNIYKYQYTTKVLLLSLASNIEGLEKSLYLGFVDYLKLREAWFKPNENSV